eukprot:gene3984-4340_t
MYTYLESTFGCETDQGGNPVDGYCNPDDFNLIFAGAVSPSVLGAYGWRAQRGACQCLCTSEFENEPDASKRARATQAKESSKQAKFLNRKYPGAEFGLTSRSFMTEQEISRTSNDLRCPAAQPDCRQAPDISTTTHKFRRLQALPLDFDWRTAGKEGKTILRPVENQGTCGSCWAFAATGVVESAYAIKEGLSGDIPAVSLFP